MTLRCILKLGRPPCPPGNFFGLFFFSRVRRGHMKFHFLLRWISLTHAQWRQIFIFRPAQLPICEVKMFYLLGVNYFHRRLYVGGCCYCLCPTGGASHSCFSIGLSPVWDCSDRNPKWPEMPLNFSCLTSCSGSTWSFFTHCVDNYVTISY